MNLFVGFRATFETSSVARSFLRIAASTLYRVYVNGGFLCHGPARGPHGFYRVDEWGLANVLSPGRNLIAIEVAGYNSNGYYVLDQPSFLQAEVVADDRVLAATAGGGGGFEARILDERIRKVQRYSFQRPSIEAYRMGPDYDRWRKDISADFPVVQCGVVAEKRLIPRRVSCPRFCLRQPVWDVSCGEIKTGVPVSGQWKSRSLTDIGPELKGFTEDKLEIVPSIELQGIETTAARRIDEPVSGDAVIQLEANAFHILDFGTNLTGFLGARIRCEKDVRLFLTFDEILSGGDVDFKRMNCVNIISYELQPGTYEVESFEPYTLRYLKLIAVDGACEVERIILREYANSDVFEARFACSGRDLNRIFEAGRETFRQNAVDIFMDCPSRERAGWLCDSFFTSRVAADLCGDTTIEKNFFENYLLPAGFPHHPEGMLPMCYPADHDDGNFIPNWAMWFVVQLEEYLARSGDREMVDALKPRVLRLFDYFAGFRNEDGLLEKLDKWVFVEWSKANEFVQDVNYPTNMLYAAALDAAAGMYGLGRFAEEAGQIRNVIRGQAFGGEFFVDNAVRKNGKLEVTSNRTETCQYYAFFFRVATAETYPGLWTLLAKHFGPRRKQTNAFPHIHMSNAFVGNYMRLELLSRYGLNAQLLREAKQFFTYMAERTGTLWENVDTHASCNHGFASHVVHVLYRDALGIQAIDAPNKKITLRLPDPPLDWCEGRIPVGDDAVSLEWWRAGDELHYRVRVPAGFSVEAGSPAGRAIVQHP